MKHENVTDRVLITVDGSAFGLQGMTFSKVFPKTEGEEIEKLFKEFDELTPVGISSNVTLKYMTNKEYLVLVQFELTLNGPKEAFESDRIKTVLDRLREQQPKKEH